MAQFATLEAWAFVEWHLRFIALVLTVLLTAAVGTSGFTCSIVWVTSISAVSTAVAAVAVARPELTVETHLLHDGAHEVFEFIFSFQVLQVEVVYALLLEFTSVVEDFVGGCSDVVSEGRERLVCGEPPYKVLSDFQWQGLEKVIFEFFVAWPFATSRDVV